MNADTDSPPSGKMDTRENIVFARFAEKNTKMNIPAKRTKNKPFNLNLLPLFVDNWGLSILVVSSPHTDTSGGAGLPYLNLIL